MDIFNLSVSDISKKMEAKEYTVFDVARKNYNVNLVGIRDPESVNTFNDAFYCFWSMPDGADVLPYATTEVVNGDRWAKFVARITTDPGTYWLKNPMAYKGTAIVKPGQYKDLWTFTSTGHRPYPFMEQTGQIKVYRDNNKDNNLTMGVVDTGYFGIELHHAAAKGVSIEVDKWSAGCQVFCDPEQYADFIYIANEASKLWGKKFTYTLLESKDFV